MLVKILKKQLFKEILRLEYGEILQLVSGVEICRKRIKNKASKQKITIGINSYNKTFPMGGE